jgi:heavy metal sensor kinase
VTLTTRLSLFFLAMLAVVLAGYSVALYLLARTHLYRQTEDRLQAVLNTLAAAAEVGPGGVEWERSERPPGLGLDTPGEELVWLVQNERGRVLEQSRPTARADFLVGVAERLGREQHTADEVEGRGESWQVGQRWLRSTGDAPSPTRPAPGQESRHRALAITVAISLEPVRGTLWLLAAALTGVSLAVWLLALAAARTVCRRALRPVSRMAASTRAMDAADLGRRLPAVATGDELEELSRAFNGLLDRVQESFERQRRFTGDASHQLRTPLTALLGQVEVALRRERTPEEYRQVLATVQRQAVHLGRIVEALLFLARAAAEARLPDLVPISLEAWLVEHLRTWSEHPRAADLRLERAPAPPARVEVQPALLGELVNILIANACKYSVPGSPIALRLAHADGLVRLSVEDQGCGIAAEDLPHLGQPFFRSAEARRRGIAGVGLGLAIARRLAEAFGGTLAIASREGVGSQFTVSLPASKPDLPA